MSDDQIKPDFTSKPPTLQDLPQGVDAFLAALKMAHEANGEVFAPYAEKMPWLRTQFEQIQIKLKEAGMWMNDALNMITNPQMFQAPKPESEDAPPQEDQ